MFKKFRKQWINVEAVQYIVPGGKNEVVVRLLNGDKFSVAGEDAHEFLKTVKVDPREFFAVAEEPAPAPVEPEPTPEEKAQELEETKAAIERDFAEDDE